MRAEGCHPNGATTRQASQGAPLGGLGAQRLPVTRCTTVVAISTGKVMASIIAPAWAGGGSAGCPRLRWSLAWVRQQAAVTSPIVGVTKIKQLEDAIASTQLTLGADELARLEGPYESRDPEWF